MNSMRSILVVGTDPMLLETRRMLLEGCGFGVWVASSVEAAEELLRMKTVVLLVLCYTLSARERKRVVAAAHETNPDIVTVVMVAAYKDPVEESDVILHWVDGPREFLRTIQNVLQ